MNEISDVLSGAITKIVKFLSPNTENEHSLQSNIHYSLEMHFLNWTLKEQQQKSLYKSDISFKSKIFKR